MITFHSASPIPNEDDIYNFIGGSRDGFNVSDSNGLDGPLNDNYTYVANDRPYQGQTFTTPAADNALAIKTIWIRVVGYTDNGAAPEAGYNGTDMDFSAGGTFRVALGRPNFPGDQIVSGLLFQTYDLTGLEANNPAPSGRVTTTNGPGTWMKIDFEGGTVLLPNTLYAFDVTSTAIANRLFEWLGTKDNVYAGGAAYNGSLPGAASASDHSLNSLLGDRVFLIELGRVPEPMSAGLAAIGLVGALAAARRRVRRA